MTASTANRIMEQALLLPKAKQKALLGRLWKQLDAEHVQPPSPNEIERRAASVRAGTAATHRLGDVARALNSSKKAALKRRQKARPSQ